MKTNSNSKINWYSELSKIERHTSWACFGGYAFDALNAALYALLAPVLITVLGFTKPEIGMLSTIGLIGNGIGGWLGGIAADRVGRVKMLKATIVWVAAFSAIAAGFSSYNGFLVVRFLQGLGFGGEAAVAGVLLSEVMRPHLRGQVVSAVQSGHAIGQALSLAAMAIVFQFFPAEIGWRIMFIVGAVPGLLALYVQYCVPESEIYETAAAARRAGKKAQPFWTIFSPSNRRATLAGLLVATGVYGASFSIHHWLPTYLRMNLNLPVASTAGYLAASFVGVFIGPIISGVVSDRIGRRTTFVVFLLCESAVIVGLLFMSINLELALGLVLLQGTLQGGLNACLLPAFVELFKTDIRANGTGFCITGGRGCGAIATTAVGFLATIMPLGHAMGVATLGAFGVAILAAIFLPERSGVDLHDVDRSDQGKGS